jgi:hypothetical protein
VSPRFFNPWEGAIVMPRPPPTGMPITAENLALLDAKRPPPKHLKKNLATHGSVEEVRDGA